MLVDAFLAAVVGYLIMEVANLRQRITALESATTPVQSTSATPDPAGESGTARPSRIGDA